MKRDIVLVQPNCGKYDLFILDMPLSLLYTARLLIKEGYRVSLIDQRVEGDKTFSLIKKLLERKPIWIGITTMTGEPIQHALHLSRFIKKLSNIPVVWGGIHPTILPEQTLSSPLVDFVISGKGERSALILTEHLLGKKAIEDVPGLTYYDTSGKVRQNEEDDEMKWAEMPMVPYHLINVDRYWRVGFEKKIFSIMTSRNCPHKCTFCYNSSLKRLKPWFPDSIDYVKKHIDFILDQYRPDYLSFIDDDFFINHSRSFEILKHLADKKSNMKVGFRGARISDLAKLDDNFLDLLESINTRHINIGVESGSPRILEILKKGITVDMTIEVNRRLAKRPTIIPLYNFFSGIPQETEADIKLSTELILKLVDENPYCQISGYHQYTPYPGNVLYKEAVKQGFSEPENLEDWGALHFEDNALNCPWIDRERRKLLDMVYSMIYFIDNKYETYIANHKPILRALLPFVKLYKPLARLRLKHHLTVFPIEVAAKNLIYRYLYGC